MEGICVKICAAFAAVALLACVVLAGIFRRIDEKEANIAYSKQEVWELWNDGDCRAEWEDSSDCSTELQRLVVHYKSGNVQVITYDLTPNEGWYPLRTSSEWIFAK